MALTADQIVKATNQEKLDHTVWAARSMGPTIPRFDANGKQNGETSVNIEAAWNAANFAKVNGKLDGILEALKQVAKAQGATIDLEAVKAAAKAGAEEALSEGVVKVDVSVQGQPNG